MSQQQFVTDSITDAENEPAKAVASSRTENADQATEIVQNAVAEVSEYTAEVEQILSEMREEVRLHSRRDRLFDTWFFALFLSVILFPLCYAGSKSISDQANMWLHYGPFALLVPTLALSIRTLIFDMKVGKRTLELTSQIEAMNDLRLVGPLVEMLWFGNPAVHNMAKANLMRLLPLIKESDAALINRVQRQQLNKFVGIDRYEPNHFIGLWSRKKRKRGVDAAFQLAILAAYEQIGDASNLASVYSIAYPTERILKKVQPEVIEAALHCLPFLEGADEIDRASRQLLRPSSASEVMPDTLLRAATGQTMETRADSLLRASDTVDALHSPDTKVPL